MKTLKFDRKCSVIRLLESNISKQPLVDQLRTEYESCENIMLDVKGILFTSLLIGELASVIRAFNDFWGNRPHNIALVNLNASSRQVMEIVKFDDLIPLFDDAGEALTWFFDPDSRSKNAV